MDHQVNIKNRKASFEFNIESTIEAGLVLTGTEIKSVKEGQASISEAYCVFQGHELMVRGMHISEYSKGSHQNHEPKRDRKLLLHRSELKKLLARVREKGFTIIPLRMYLNEKGYAKLEIGLARGKKLHDKRHDLRKKQDEREMAALKKKNEQNL